jgi:hypothetical protein
MTDHRRWLELAAAAPAFTPAPPQADGLAAHLASCPSCSQRTTAFRADLAAVGGISDPGLHEDLRERIRGAVHAEPAGLNPVLLVAILGLLLAAVVGTTLTVGSGFFRSDDTLPPPANVPDLSGKQLVWQTQVVHLGADSLDLQANGRTVHALTNTMRVDGDPGGLSRWTLELTWFEAGLEQRINLSFASDGAQWWIDQVQAYDGVVPDPKWAVFDQRPLAVTPMGGVFHGDLVAQGKGRAGEVDLRIKGVVLAVTPQASFTDPMGGATRLGSDPFLPGGPLHCSGILQQAPMVAEQELLARGYRLGWRVESAKGAGQGFAEPTARAPAAGWITSTAIGTDGELIVFVADPTRPFAKPATMPPDCATRGG